MRYVSRKEKFGSASFWEKAWRSLAVAMLRVPCFPGRTLSSYPLCKIMPLITDITRICRLSMDSVHEKSHLFIVTMYVVPIWFIAYPISRGSRCTVENITIQ